MIRSPLYTLILITRYQGIQRIQEIRNMRILITGASGLLGLNLALEIAGQHTVFGQVNRHDLHTDAFTVLKADLLEPGAVGRLLSETRPDWVIHCAALADLERCEKNPGLAWELNTEIPRNLALFFTENEL